MKRATVLATVVSAGIAFFIQTAGAQDLPHIAAQCPNAAAWLKSSHDGLTPQERAQLKAIKPSNPVLATHLAQRYTRDQAAEDTAASANAFEAASSTHARTKAKFIAMLPKPLQHLMAVQKDDLEWFKPIVEAHGFPTVQEVGPKGIKHAWLLVQHANADPKFQAKVLAELKPRLTAEPFLRSDYALLTDRVRLAQRKQQIYGSQFTTKDGRLVMKPTEDVARLDERRASMNLMPISEYRCFLGVLYHVGQQPAPRHPAGSSM